MYKWIDTTPEKIEKLFNKAYKAYQKYEKKVKFADGSSEFTNNEDRKRWQDYLNCKRDLENVQSQMTPTQKRQFTYLP